MPQAEIWSEIVPPLPAAEAERRLDTWKREHEQRPEDLRRDQVLGEASCLVRFLVRAASTQPSGEATAG